MSADLAGFGPGAAPPRVAALRQSFRLAIADSIVAQPLVMIAQPANVYLATLFTKGYGLSAAAIGCITALPFACQVLQLPVSPFIARWFSSKSATLVCVALQLAMWIGLGVSLAWLPRDDPSLAAWSIGAWYFLSCLAGSIGGVAWSGWLQEWVPPRLLGKFFGHRNRLAQCGALAALFGSGWVLVKFDYAITAFQGVIAAAALLRVVSFVLLWRSPALAEAARIERTRPLGEQWVIVRRNRAFMQSIWLGALWAFGANCFGPFYNVFMLEQLSFSAFDISLFAMLFVLGGILALPAWGRSIDRHGHKPVLQLSLLLWQAPALLWCLLTFESRHLLYFLWVWSGVTSAGLALGQFTLSLKLVPPEAKNLGFALSIAFTSISGALAPAAGGLGIGWALARWPDHALAVYHGSFLLQPLVALLAVVMLARLDEPRASTLRGMLRTRRRAPRSLPRPARSGAGRQS